MDQDCINWVKATIVKSGIGTKTQREAMCQRIQDRFDELIERSKPRKD